MKKYIIYICSILTAALCLSGCGDQGPDAPELEPGLYLRVSASGANVQTKVGEGETAWNENVLNSVYYFFYATAEADADPSTAMPKVHGHFAGLASETRTTGIMEARRIPVSSSIIANELFPPGTQTCRVFVVANPTSDIVSALEAGPSLGDLRAMVISANFATTSAQDDFVMVYDSEETVSSRLDTNIMTVDAQLIRLACKFTLTTKVPENVHDDVTGYWISLPSAMKVTFVNGLSRTNLLGDFGSLSVSDSDYFESAETSFSTPSLSAGMYTANSSSPLYSYPMEWEFADDAEPYFLFELPWKNTGATAEDSGSGRYQSCYYKIMLSVKHTLPNSWMNITVKLDALGSFYRQEPTQQYLYEDYQIYDWHDAFYSEYNNVDAEIRDARYLEVDNNYFELDNQSVWDIPFISSHDCEIVNATYTRPNYSVNPPSVSSPANISGLSPACTISLGSGLITFSKPLRNDISAGAGNYDYVPITYTFTIRHIDNHSYSQDITIVQYPGLYISATVNSVNNTVPNQRTNTTAYVNNNNGTIGGISIDNIGGATNGQAAGNRNGVMYIVSISAISDGSDYVIMDPRTSTVDLKLNGGQNWTVTAPALYDGASNRQLRYYYPTNSDESYSNAIAPQFRIASSWGACSAISYDNAVRRCASYQEDGYPAGRWRIPTKAEVEYMITLSNDGAIPQLFTPEAQGTYNTFHYWCASGVIYPWTNGTHDYKNFTDARAVYNTNTHAVRCVYDEWYWKNTDVDVTNGSHPTTGGRMATTDYNTFVWGDMPK